MSTTSTTPAEPDEPAVGAASPGTAGPPPAPRSAYSMGSTANILRSLLVIVGMVAVLIAIVPRVSKVEQPAVDAASVVANAVRVSGLPFEAPVGLPAGWKATSARYERGTDDLLTWQAGWTTPQGGFVGIRQTKAASPKWLTTVTNGGRLQGDVPVSGRTWQRLYDRDHDQTSLVLQPADPATGLTTVVAATAGMDEILLFTNALEPAPPR